MAFLLNRNSEVSLSCLVLFADRSPRTGLAAETGFEEIIWLVNEKEDIPIFNSGSNRQTKL